MWDMHRRTLGICGGGAGELWCHAGSERCVSGGPDCCLNHCASVSGVWTGHGAPLARAAALAGGWAPLRPRLALGDPNPVSPAGSPATHGLCGVASLRSVGNSREKMPRPARAALDPPREGHARSPCGEWALRGGSVWSCTEILLESRRFTNTHLRRHVLYGLLPRTRQSQEAVRARV